MPAQNQAVFYDSILNRRVAQIKENEVLPILFEFLLPITFF